MEQVWDGRIGCPLSLEVGTPSMSSPHLQAAAGVDSPGLTCLLPQMQWFVETQWAPSWSWDGGQRCSEVEPKGGQAAQQTSEVHLSPSRPLP